MDLYTRTPPFSFSILSFQQRKDKRPPLFTIRSLRPSSSSDFFPTDASLQSLSTFPKSQSVPLSLSAFPEAKRATKQVPVLREHAEKHLMTSDATNMWGSVT